MKPLLLDQCRAFLVARALSRPEAMERISGRAVTISRETGAGAMSVSQLLREYLEKEAGPNGEHPWAVFDRNLVSRVLTDQKLPQTLEKYMPEDGQHRLKDLLEEILGVHPSSYTLVQQTNHTILALALQGNVILIGRGAHLVTASLKNALHVRLVAPLENRIRHMEEYSHLSREEAEVFVRKSDQAKVRYLRKNFNEGTQSPLAFHLTINTGRVSFSEAARLIGDAVMRMPL